MALLDEKHLSEIMGRISEDKAMNGAKAPTHQANGYSYVRVSECPIGEQAVFEHWLCGQTRPFVPGLEPQDAAYSWDYERWREQGMRLEQRIEDWD